MLTTPVKREERDAREREQDGEEYGQTENGTGEDPRSLEKRVKRLAALGWPRWEGSSTTWTVNQFAKLSEEDRRRAEERAPVYLARNGKKALSLGTYFLERKFDDLPESAVRAVAEVEQRKVAAPFGKLWGAVRLCWLLSPPSALPKPSAFIERLLEEGGEMAERTRRDRLRQHGWPRVGDMHRAAEGRRGITVSPDLRWLERHAAEFEQVKVGSDLWLAWEAEHERRCWPWFPDPGRQQWVYFPAGGPDGLATFEAAINSEAQGNDGGGREAAE